MIRVPIVHFLMMLALIATGCGRHKGKMAQTVNEDVTPEQRNYRNDMRGFIRQISAYAKARDSSFYVIPQNGIELVTDTGYADGSPILHYLNAIDGNGQENLHYGYHSDNSKTPKRSKEYMKGLLAVSQRAGNTILVIDYCSSEKKIADAFDQSYSEGYVPFVATERNLTVIPKFGERRYRENTRNIRSLADAENFLFFLNYERFESKPEVLNAIARSNYDIVFIDLFFHDGTTFSAEEVQRLKTKANGSERLVCCYMSIGEAEDYRYYWKKGWATNRPSWLEKENKRWAGNYKVRYWEKDWQGIIMGSQNAYLDKIIDTGFDGVYLDIVDAFEYFESK
ncbi:endo alpha-1,4 polygalactosaminidase [Maribacter sp. 2-571]|uniref:endo alpha-1,4 polygalactosaminidase n=1 Tax=Maribacter sp. 2-571 TaxID=3417569 RepID=UPI003D34C661